MSITLRSPLTWLSTLPMSTVWGRYDSWTPSRHAVWPTPSNSTRPPPASCTAKSRRSLRKKPRLFTRAHLMVKHTYVKQRRLVWKHTHTLIITKHFPRPSIVRRVYMALERKIISNSYLCFVCVRAHVREGKCGGCGVSSPHTLGPNVWLKVGAVPPLTKTPLCPRRTHFYTHTHTHGHTHLHTRIHTHASRTRVRGIIFPALCCLKCSPPWRFTRLSALTLRQQRKHIPSRGGLLIY